MADAEIEGDLIPVCDCLHRECIRDAYGWSATSSTLHRDSVITIVVRKGATLELGLQLEIRSLRKHELGCDYVGPRELNPNVRLRWCPF